LPGQNGIVVIIPIKVLSVVVARGNAVGLDAGGTKAAYGTEVGEGADVADGLVAFGESLPSGTAIAEDPQASIGAKNVGVSCKFSWILVY
jgi:hypothetical protein